MPGCHLTPVERGKIEAYLKQGLLLSAIATRLGRVVSTISREITRNSTAKGYCAQTAQERYEMRRAPCRPKTKMDYKPLRDFVIEKIREEEWTPEIVAKRLPVEYPDIPGMRISHETVYRAIYAQDALRFLLVFLPQRRPKRRKRGQGKTRRGPSIPNRVGIAQRPKHIEERKEAGHWEGDTVVGKNQDGFILTLVERSSRLLHAVKTTTKCAAEVASAAIDALIDRPVSWVKTITFDNGTEFAHHERIARDLGVDIYFADPYSAYQRGTNEQVNGLIRRYLPKGTSFKSLSNQELHGIVERINNRPRKCLGYRSPYEVFQLQRHIHRIALRT
jgi:IS30 family transposase